MSNNQIGVIGDDATIYGGIHFHAQKKTLPMQLPKRAEHFTGRRTELQKLLTDLKPGHIITLCGPGGVGKSALAAEALWKLAPNNEPPKIFPDGIIWHDFYREPNTDQALEHIARSFGEEPKPTPLDAAKRALSGRQALLLLDGTEEVEDLHKVLSIIGDCGALVTSRTRDDAGVDRRDIQSLEPTEAIKLLQAWGMEYAADETPVSQICMLVDGLPLAVRLVGNYLNTNQEPAAEYLRWLRESPLEALNHGDRKLKSVPLLLKRSLQQVSSAAIDVLAVTGLLSFAPFSMEAITAALPESQIKQPLNELVRYGLLLKAGNTYMISHALVHTYVRKHHLAEHTVIKNLSSYYSIFTREQRQQGLRGYERLDTQRAHIMRILSACKGTGNWQSVKNLVWATDEYLNMRGYWIERKIALNTAITAARKLKNRQDEGAFLGSLGITFRDLGQVEKAIGCFELSLAIFREIGDRHNEGSGLGNLGLSYRSLGQVEKAIEYHGQALVISREIGDRRGEGTYLCNLGTAYSDLGQVEKGIGYYEQALAISREIGDGQGEGITLGALGSAYHSLGQVEKGIRYYEQALVISRKIGDRRNEGNDLGNLGTAYSDLGQVERAIRCYEQALVIFREIGDRLGEGGDLASLGTAYRHLGQVEKGIGYYEQALAISREIGDRRGEGNRLGNLGTAYFSLGQLEKGIRRYEQALAVSREIGDRRGEGTVLGNLGIAYFSQGQLEKGIRYYEQALAISREVGDRQGEGNHLANLGNAYRSLEQLEKGIRFYKQSLAIFREIGARQGEGTVLGNLGLAYYSLGQVEKAIGYHEKALAISREIGDRQGEGAGLGNLGLAYYSLGQVEKAIGFYEQALAIFKKIKSPNTGLVEKKLSELRKMANK